MVRIHDRAPDKPLQDKHLQGFLFYCFPPLATGLPRAYLGITVLMFGLIIGYAACHGPPSLTRCSSRRPVRSTAP
jgi:hypothetical protein